MRKIIVCGKGGAGKTTVTSFLITLLAQEKKDAKILVVDADPSANLSISLGLTEKPEKPIGELDQLMPNDWNIRSEEFLGAFRSSCLKQVTISETQLDYGYLGHHVSNSCLCSYNNSLNYLLKHLQTEDAYDYVILDREAGVEHINRSVYGGENDRLIIVTWPSEEYLTVAQDISELADMLGTSKHRMLVLNNLHNLEFSESDVRDALNEKELVQYPLLILPQLKLQNGLKKRNAAEVLDTVSGTEKEKLHELLQFAIA